MILAVLTHIFALLYSWLAPQVMDALGTRLALAGVIVGVVTLIALCVLNIVVASAGLHESSRFGRGRGLANMGFAVSLASFLLWLVAGTNVLLAVIDRLR
jgi:hypothetical protein